MALDLRGAPDHGAPIPPPPVPRESALRLDLQPKQYVAFCTQATELLYGGAAFGGKSHLMRVCAIQWCSEIPGLMVYIFRRVEDDLIKNHMEGPHGFRELLAQWVEDGFCKIIETEIRFWNGSKIFLCHCKDEKHRYKYHGAEIHVLMVDELTTFTEVIYRYLRFRTRMVGIKFNADGTYKDTYPRKYRKGEIGPNGQVNEWDLFPRVICGSNPGNVGHHWVKREFIDAVPMMEVWKTPDSAGGMHRQYIPAKVADNPIGQREDPEYVARMRGLQDKALVKAMEEGDWNVLAGGFFPEFSRSRHVVKVLTIPPHWKRFRAHDWGSARPFSVGWYAIAQEDIQAESAIGSPVKIIRGSLVKYREWYGAKEDMNNIGIDLPIESYAKGILLRSRKDPLIEYDTADPSMFNESGGPSLAERAQKVTIKQDEPKRTLVLNMRHADNERLAGWNQVRQRLQGDDPLNGVTDPTLFIFENCPDTIRTFESVVRDETDIEDLDTDGEDHAADETRYGCMSRPRARPEEDANKKAGPPPGSFEWLIQQGWKAPPSTMGSLTRRKLD